MATETYKIYGYLSGGRRTVRESGTHDVLYGSGQVRAPEYLRIVKDGVILSGEETMAEFAKPQWGNGSQTLEEILPILPAKVYPVLSAPFYEWHPYDPDDEATHPTQDPYEIWGGRLGNAMYWECEGAELGKYYQGAAMTYVNHEVIWKVLGIKRYRRMKQSPAEDAYIPNPEFPIVEAERAAKREQFHTILRAILTPVGHYQFRGLPTGDDPRRTDPNKYGYGWNINTVDIPVDPAHRLAIPAWGWKFLPAPMRNPENVITKFRDSTGVIYTKGIDHHETTLNGFIECSLDISPYSVRMKTLLHL